MDTVIRGLLMLIRKGLLITFCVVVLASTPTAAQNKSKSLERIHDPVVIEGSKFPDMMGEPLGQLSLMVIIDNRLSPIPFQIDQKKPDGNYAYTMGPQASTDPDPNFDGNDELVFMVKDVGDRADQTSWPPAARIITQIEITDPKNGQKGWAYLVRYSGEPPRSEDDYIRVEIDKAGKYRRVISYEYEMSGPTDSPSPDLMRAATGPGGTGPGIDVADRIKIRGDIVLIGGITIPFKMDEMTKARDLGYIDGPIRVLHLTQGYLEFTKYLTVEIKQTSLVSYYANHLSWPVYIDLPASALKVINKIDVYGYFDFCPAIYGSYPFNAANPYNTDVVFDGKMSEAEKNLDTKTPIDWNAGFGPHGAVINRLYFVPKGDIELYTYFVDDKTKSDPPEDCAGVSAMGYKMVGFEKRTNIVALQYYYFLKKLKPEQINDILDIHDHPVKVGTKSIHP